MKSISIIIPVYNTGVYLYKCVESVLNQTFSDIEVVIVDDGSESATAHICDELAQKDTRLRVFHKTNEGVSVARNYGIERATGRYIGFVDSDDWIEKDMYQIMFTAITEHGVDIVYCDATTRWADGCSETDTFDAFHDSQLVMTTDLAPDALVQMAGSVCRGLYAGEIVRSISFPVGLKFSEDRYFNLQAIAKSHKIYYCKQSFYNRFMRSDSCVNSYHQDSVSTILQASKMINTFVEHNFGGLYLIAYKQQEVVSFIGALYRVYQSGKNIKGRYAEIKKIASTPELLSLLGEIPYKDIRTDLIRKRRYISLYVLLSVHDAYNKLFKKR